MKKFLLIPVIVLVLVLFGCEKDLREIEEATLIEKKDIGEGAFPTYVFIFEKDGQRIQLYAENDNQYNSLTKGTIVDVIYNANNYDVDDIKFIKLEREVKR